jgi:hypothetical protein
MNTTVIWRSLPSMPPRTRPSAALELAASSGVTEISAVGRIWQASRTPAVAPMRASAAASSPVGDLNITGVWGTGDLSEKPVGFTDVRAKVHFEAERPREELEALIAHARKWSPVANTFTRPVSLEVKLA